MNYILSFNAVLAFIAPIAGHVDIDITIALAWFLIVHRCQVTIAPTLAVELPSWSCRPSPSRLALHHPQFVITLSIATHRHCALGPLPLRSRRPLPMKSRCAVPHHRGAAALSIAVTIEEPLRGPLPSRSRRAVHCCCH